MIRLHKCVLLAGFGLLPHLAAQEAQHPAAPESRQPQAEAKAGQTKADVPALIKDLGSETFRVRLDAENRLRQLGQDALPALKAAAEKNQDAEVQWRARRLVRQIESGDKGGLEQRSQSPVDDATPAPIPMPRRNGGQDGVQRRFDRLFEQLERDFGMDIPRERFFHDDFFQDLRAQMDDLQRQMQQMQTAPGGKAGHGQGLSMQMGPDGVRVEVQERNEKGELERKVYEAPDMDAFRKKYPGVLENSGIAMFPQGMRLWQGGFGQFPAAPGQIPAVPGQNAPAPLTPRKRAAVGLQPRAAEGQDDVAVAAPPPADRRLGVAVRPEIPADVRDYLGLENGRGIQVEDVQEGTLAVALGLQKGDIVLEIAGHAIGGTDDVQKAVGSVPAGADVDVTVLRHGKELKLSAKKAAAAPALEQRKAK